MMIYSGVFTQEQIHANLEHCYTLPFIDDSIKMDGVPPYGEDFGPGDSMWEKWREAQKESFVNPSRQKIIGGWPIISRVTPINAKLNIKNRQWGQTAGMFLN